MKLIELELFTRELRMMQFLHADLKNSEITDLLKNAVIEGGNGIPFDEGVTRYDPDVYDDIESINMENNEGSGFEVYLTTDNENEYACLIVKDEDGNRTEYDDIIDECNDRTIFLRDYLKLFDDEVNSYLYNTTGYYRFRKDSIDDLVTNDVDLDEESDIESIDDLVTYDVVFANRYSMDLSEVSRIRNTETYEYDDAYQYTELLRRIKENDPKIQTDFMSVHVKSILKQYDNSEYDEAALLRSSIIGKGSVLYQIELEDDEEFDINKLFFISGVSGCMDNNYADCMGFSYIFDGYDLILDFIIYDGKVIPRYGEASWRGIKDFGNTVLMNPDMTKYE